MFDMITCNPLSTLRKQKLMITINEGNEFKDTKKYKCLTRSLVYLITTNLDISFFHWNYTQIYATTL